MTQNEKKHILRAFKELGIYDAIHTKVLSTTPIDWEGISSHFFVTTCFRCQEVVQMLTPYEVTRHNFFLSQSYAIRQCFDKVLLLYGIEEKLRFFNK